MDPRNVELLSNLAQNYKWLRRYRDWNRIVDQAIELQPDDLGWRLVKAESAFWEKAEVSGGRAAYEALPSSWKDLPVVTTVRVYNAMCARDFGAAEQIVSKSPNEEIFFPGFGVPSGIAEKVPCQIVALWLEFLQGKRPTMEQFGAAREQLYRKVQADPSNPFLMTALAFADVCLGRKEESIQEGRHAVEMRPVSKDAIDGVVLAGNVAMVYACANQLDSAFEQLDTLAKIPVGLTYADLKLNPGWDPLRKDPRFDKLLAELAPRD